MSNIEFTQGSTLEIVFSDGYKFESTWMRDVSIYEAIAGAWETAKDRGYTEWTCYSNEYLFDSNLNVEVLFD